MNNSDISTNELIARYINFSENNIPVVTEYIEYISSTERHIFEAINHSIQNDRIRTNNENNENNASNINAYRHASSNVGPRTRIRPRPYNHVQLQRDYQHNIRQHNINNNRMRGPPIDISGNNVIGNLMNLFNDLNNDINNNNLTTPIPQNLTPVIVRPSVAQINSATEILLFSDIENPLNNNCPILVEPFQPTNSVARIRHCGHCFDPVALEQWFSLNVRCPVCRYDIRTNSYNREESVENANTEQIADPAAQASADPAAQAIPTSTPPTTPEQTNHNIDTPTQPVSNSFIDPSSNILYTFQYFNNLQ